ncbi:hypothetical protein [Pseudotabrizicola algicola]|nr:hypothetical protein [Pseudotabrizicola algicola]
MLPQTDLDERSAASIAFLKAHFDGKRLLGVPRLSLEQAAQPAGYCYQNVWRFIDELGGDIQYGWQFTQLPGKFIEAMHHAVWISPGGALVDVTDRAYSGIRLAITAFVADNGPLIPTRDCTPSIPSIFWDIGNDPLTAAYCNITIGRIAALQAIKFRHFGAVGTGEPRQKEFFRHDDDTLYAMYEDLTEKREALMRRIVGDEND